LRAASAARLAASFDAQPMPRRMARTTQDRAHDIWHHFRVDPTKPEIVRRL
jgi:hypothetical protein